jgi:hypothetical protein
MDISGPKAIGIFWKRFRYGSKPDPAALDREHRKDNAPRRNSWPKTQQRQCPQGAIVSSTVQTVYDYSVVHSAMSLHPQ